MGPDKNNNDERTPAENGENKLCISSYPNVLIPAILGTIIAGVILAIAVIFIVVAALVVRRHRRKNLQNARNFPDNSVKMVKLESHAKQEAPISESLISLGFVKKNFFFPNRIFFLFLPVLH